jgi:hypothetical protein
VERGHSLKAVLPGMRPRGIEGCEKYVKTK